MNEGMNLSKEQMDNLVKSASKCSGAGEDAVKNAINSGSLDEIVGKLKPNQAKMLQKVLSDRQAAQQLLSTPQARMLLKKLLDK